MEGGGVLQPSPFIPSELGSSTSGRISFLFSLLSSQYLRWVINRGLPGPHVLERQRQTNEQRDAHRLAKSQEGTDRTYSEEQW